MRTVTNVKRNRSSNWLKSMNFSTAADSLLQLDTMGRPGGRMFGIVHLSLGLYILGSV